MLFLQIFTFDLVPNLDTDLLSATGKDSSILREVISDRKLDRAGQYVIYSVYAAICRSADGNRILTTSV